MSDAPDVLVETPVEPLVIAPDGAPEAPPKSLEDVVLPGSKIDRTESGWRASLMYGGARRLVGEGPTIEEAVRTAFGGSA